jgi:hypothetical protein
MLSGSDAMLLDDTPGRISDGQLENAFCRIDGQGSRLHPGLLSLKADPHPRVDQYAYCCAKRREESIASIEMPLPDKSCAASHVKRQAT